jgi:hypothetical protein
MYSGIRQQRLTNEELEMETETKPNANSEYVIVSDCG